MKDLIQLDKEINYKKRLYRFQKDFKIGAKVKYIKKHPFYYYSEYLQTIGTITRIDTEDHVTVEMHEANATWGIDLETMDYFEVLK